MYQSLGAVKFRAVELDSATELDVSVSRVVVACGVAFLPSSLHGSLLAVIATFEMLVVEHHRLIETG